MARIHRNKLPFQVLEYLYKRAGLLSARQIHDKFNEIPFNDISRALLNLHKLGHVRRIPLVDPSSPTTRFGYQFERWPHELSADEVEALDRKLRPRPQYAPLPGLDDLGDVLSGLGVVPVSDPQFPVETKPTNPKDRAATSRLDLTLFPDTAAIYGALAFTEGDLKYGGYNYREAGVSASVYYAACKRHLAKWYNGEEADPKTHIPHLASALACVAVLIDSNIKGVMSDDRPPKAPVAELLSDLEETVKHLQAMFANPPARYTEKSK